WERAVPATIAGTAVLGLASEDLLLYLAMHVSYQHYFIMGVRPFLDIAAVVRRYGSTLDWGLVQQRAGRWHWRKGTYVALRLAKELVGAAVPDDVLHALRPADFDEAILAAAREQSLTDSVVSIGVSPGVAHLKGAARLQDKVPQLLRDVFPSTQTIYRDYGVSPESSWVYPYYVVRLKDLFVKRSRVVWQMLRGDRETVLAAERNSALWQWLSE
ncbi:MAG: nucleotidyltransferase family protein, partial [Chloroflexi bacterium]|nr:nucleotidyltransferase family protein [Chloroflexota bacterium]